MIINDKIKTKFYKVNKTKKLRLLIIIIYKYYILIVLLN